VTTSGPVARAADPGKAWRVARGIPVVPAFDGFRALAIAAVVLFHVFQVSGVLHAAGRSALGVVAWGVLPRALDALFIVSGFVIYMPTVARRGEFGRVWVFALRRAARLIPGYWLSLVIAVLILAVVSDSPGEPGAGSILLHVSVLQTPALLFHSFPVGFGVISPVWTLSVEVGFYVVLPLVAAWYYRRPFVGLALAAVLAVGWREVAEHATRLLDLVGIQLGAAAQGRLDNYYGSQFPSWALALAAGMTAAWLYVRLRDAHPEAVLARWAVWATLGAGLAWGFFVYLAGHQAVHDPNPFTGLFARQSQAVSLGYPTSMAAFMVAVSLGPRWLQRPVANRAMSWAADISYGVYLIHFAVVFVCLHELSLPGDGSFGALLAWAAITYPASMLYAWLSARFLEHPVRRWAHRFGRRAQGPPAYAPV
jgi:peptidoglycan/LPS O-acetylase OafA/YrhL